MIKEEAAKRKSEWLRLMSTQPNFQVTFRQKNMFITLFLLTVNALRVKRQSDDKKSSEEYELELCKDKDAGEWFRLVANDGDSCRDVIQCTTSVRILLINRIPHWLTFASLQRVCKQFVALLVYSLVGVPSIIIIFLIN